MIRQIQDQDNFIWELKKPMPSVQLPTFQEENEALKR
jgi:hypothetical protein